MQYYPLTVGAIILAFTATLLPDYLDAQLNLRHRSKYTHNLLIPMGTSFFILHPILVGFFIGYAHHLLIDSLTVQGIYFGNKRIKGFLYTKNIAHNLFVVLIHCLLFTLTIF